MRHIALAILVVVEGACAAKGPSAAATAERARADLARADQLVRDGCYRCLTDALAIYEKLLQPTARVPGVHERAFDTTLLLALREKELGLPSAPTFARARALARTMPVGPGMPSPAGLVEFAELLLGELSGLDPEGRARPPGAAERLKALVGELSLSQPATPVGEYLGLAFACEDRIRREGVRAEDVLSRQGNMPLFQYRLALCGFGPRGVLAQLRADNPRWVEAAFFEGRDAMSSRRPNLRKGLELYEIAHQAFPASSAMLLALAHVQRGLVQLPAALASYDGVVALVPRQRDALLGRVITLTYMERRQEAVDGATHIIDLGTWMMGDAYYWRAFNRYHLKEFDQAWADVEMASRLQANTSVFTLAGLIAYSKKELETAKDRFGKALQMDRTNCYAAWYFAVVHADQNLWPAAAPIFSSSMSCFVQSAETARKELAELEQSEQHPDDKERQSGEHRKTIEESELRAAQSAFNAAQGFGRAGKRNEALTHIDVAMAHSQLREKSEAIRKLIEALPAPITVVGSTPNQGDADVRLSTRVRLRFSDDLDAKSIDGRIRITYSRDDSAERGEPQPPPIPFATEYLPDTRSLEIRPKEGWLRFREVRVQLLDGVTGRNGSAVEPFTLVFTTGGSS